jgi:hypothetical protein
VLHRDLQASFLDGLHHGSKHIRVVLKLDFSLRRDAKIPILIEKISYASVKKPDPATIMALEIRKRSEEDITEHDTNQSVRDRSQLEHVV